MSPHDQMRDAMTAAGMNHPDELIGDGRLRRFSSTGKRGDLSAWYVFHQDGIPAGCYGDWRDGTRHTWRADIGRKLTAAELTAQRARVAASRRAAEADLHRRYKDNATRNNAVWSNGVPIESGGPVSLYLRSRGFADLKPYPACLRLHPSLSYTTNDGEWLGSFPAMVAQLTDSAGAPVALHRTYLTNEGGKADVPQVRKVTGGSGPLMGCSIKLMEPIGGQLGIAEGIETALGAFFLAGVPTQAAYSAGALAAFKWPAHVRSLVIFGDNDEAGEKAARELEARAKASGLSVSVLIPSEPGADWADVWAASKRERAAA